MILTKEEVLKEISEKRIKITPFDRKAVGPASVDLTLDSKLRIFKVEQKPLIIHDKVDYKKSTRLVDIRNGYILMPGELVLGITKEKITLPGDVCGWLNSRSRFARHGLMSHITAPFINPGVSNRQVLEIYNASPRKLKIMPGLKICQIIFQRCEGKAEYKGTFKNQSL